MSWGAAELIVAESVDGAFSDLVLNEAGIFAAPTLYAPAGGVSGRTTLATTVWLMAWAVLHNRWKAREIAPGRVGAATMILIVFGVLGTFPPVWGLL